MTTGSPPFRPTERPSLRTGAAGALLRRMSLPLLAGLLFSGCAVAPRHAAPGQEVEIGPPRGSLVIAGGGQLGPEIWGRFIDLAGGPNAPIVVIPTAGGAPEYPVDWNGLSGLGAAGATNLTVLHTYDRTVGDSEEFARQIRAARGVWFPGGRQWRLVDSYLDTRTHRELVALLDRGGVIGGSSAGASIMASYLVRGAREGNEIMMAPGYEEGFGFLREMAIDQHHLTRNRQDDLLEVLAVHPRLLAIGIDEGTAVVVRGDTMEVVGRSKVAVYDRPVTSPEPYYFLEDGARYDLRRRAVMSAASAPR